MRYLRIRTVADRVDVSERTVRRWIALEKIKSIKIGGARRVLEDELDRLQGALPEDYWEEDEA